MRTAIQTINLVLSFTGLGIWVLWAYYNRGKLGYAIPPITWLLHAWIFYTARFLTGADVPGEFFTMWSAVLRLHALILAVAIGSIILFLKARLPHE